MDCGIVRFDRTSRHRQRGVVAKYFRRRRHVLDQQRAAASATTRLAQSNAPGWSGRTRCPGLLASGSGANGKCQADFDMATCSAVRLQPDATEPAPAPRRSRSRGCRIVFASAADAVPVELWERACVIHKSTGCFLAGDWRRHVRLVLVIAQDGGRLGLAPPARSRSARMARSSSDPTASLSTSTATEPPLTDGPPVCLLHCTISSARMS